ncbi:uncharacterized protein adgrg2a isoform X2 [Alosa pseudoharengus]|uniref:uncharacterized protein adgrg2a isoform X2 n=1 Tax=Alosa pseudoharengus TaxID=34774 RepID=UPI003F8C5DA5
MVSRIVYAWHQQKDAAWYCGLPLAHRSEQTSLLTRLFLLWMIHSSVLQAHGYFMYDSKAVLGDCQDYWTFRDRERIPLLFQVTVCVDVRVVSPGPWLAFSYSSPRAPRYDLALEGDAGSLHAWLLGVRHRFPVRLEPHAWHRLCLRRDSLRNTFSLEVDGRSDAQHQRTVIARLIPPNGELTLGCRPWDAQPGSAADSRGKVELYLFRMWEDVEQHQACEDGSVAGWESRMWAVTHPRAQVRDDQLYCGKTRRKRSSDDSSSATGSPGGRELIVSTAVLPASTSYVSTTTSPPLTTPTGTTPPPQTTLTTNARAISTVAPTAKAITASTVAATSVWEKTTLPPTTGQGTQQPPVGPGSTSTSSQQTHPSTLPPSSTSTSSPTMTFDPEKATTMASTTRLVTDPTSKPTESTQSPSVSTYPPVMATSKPTQITTMTALLAGTSSSSRTNSAVTPTTRTQLANHSTAAQWTTPDRGQVVMQCNFSQFCSNTTSHYWMMISVTVQGQAKTEADLKAWLHKSVSHVETTEINCTDKTNITKTNCTVQLGLSEPVGPCGLKQQLQDAANNEGIQATIHGNVERVGKGLCVDEDMLPSGGEFVRCTYPEPYAGMCTSTQAVNVTCSVMDSEYVPATSSDPEQDSCPIEQQDRCNCESFCNDTGEYYYALRLNITSPSINLTDIQNLIFKTHSDCDSDTEQAVCENVTRAFKHFREIHLECHGNETRLHSCMVALMLNKQLGVCEVSRVMVYRLHQSRGVSFGGRLSPMAMCGGSDSPGARLLDSNLSWFSSSLTVPDFCAAQLSSSLTCKKNETKAVLLSDTCQETWPGNHSNTTATTTTTVPPNTTQFNTTTVPPNTTQSNTTTVPPNTTQSNTTTVPPNTTQFNTTTVPQNTTQSNTTSVAQDSTQLNTTGVPYTSQSNTTLTQNNTEFKDTTLQHNTTQDYTTTLPPNTTQFNTTTVPQNTTQFTISTQNSTLFNSTTLFSTTTPFPLNTTQMYTTRNESLHNGSYMNTTALPINVTQSATTYTSLNSTNFTTADVSPTSSHNITTSSPQLNTTESFTDLPSYLNATKDYNSTSIPLTTASQNASSSPTTLGVSSTTTGTNATLNVTSSYPAGPVLNQTVAMVTTPEQNTTTQRENVSLVPAVPDRTTTPATTTQPGAQSTGAVPVNPNATMPAEASTATTTTSTASPPDPEGSSRTTISTVTTETTTPTTTTTSSPGEQANQLQNLTKDVSSLNSSQVAQVVDQLEGILSGPNISLEVGRAVLSVISNLLGASASTLGSSSNRIIHAVDTLGQKLLIEGDSTTIEAASLVLSTTRVDGNNFNGGVFIIANQQSTRAKVRSERRSKRSERESTLDAGDLGMVSLPPSLTQHLSPQELKQFSRVQFSFYSKTTFFQDQALDQFQLRLNSRILSASVSNLSISNLTEDVEIILNNDQPIPENATAVCTFWDFSKNGDSGGWNSEGCSVKNTTKNQTICSCNHLTSFAVLLDLSGEGITDRLQATILSFITYIGCGVSAIFLAITLLTYISFEKLRRDIPSKILIQLCFALLLLNLGFLLDSWLALYPDAVGLCISTAFFLHYFLLASFTWMALEALHMYLAIVKVFNNYVSHYMLKFSLMGWGIPLPVVIIVIAVDKNNYGLVNYGKYADGTTDDFCWFRNEIAFYVGVVAYFCLVFVLNMSMFVVVMVQLNRVKRQNPQNNQHRSHLQDLRSIAGLTFLLGLTWGFAFFAWGPVNLAFMYLFAIFNSLQGFFIFVFHCALKDNVRRQWRIYLCCGRLRLPENSDWSRTATQNNTKKTSLATTSSVHSSNSALTQRTSRNSSMTSNVLEQSNGIHSPFEDSLITALEDTNGDVVLNEINNPYRSRRRE